MRSVFPYLALALLLAATLWAISFGSIEPADFTFCNATEIKSVDPAIVTGQPEGRIIRAIFEGLVNWHPKTLEPTPGVAENIVWNRQANRWDCISDDGLTYTFTLRRDARWSNGEPVTSHDFVYSFRRFLDPLTGNQYAELLHYVVNAKSYNQPSELRVGDRVEIELNQDEGDAPRGARGPVLRGKLVALRKFNGKPLYVVERNGKREQFQINTAPDSGARDCRIVLLDFDEVGIRAPDDHTLTITLKDRTPYFLSLLGFYPLSPVNQRCIETHGPRAWTRPENIVSNGQYLLRERRIRDRIRLVKSPTYWNSEQVRLEVIDALAVESYVTMLNMYEAGQVDWIPHVPQAMVDELLDRERRRPPGVTRQFDPAPMLQSYFYRINVTRAPFKDVRVRQALSLALDRKEIVETATKAGEITARSLVPPGIDGYEQAVCAPRDVKRARQLLAEAGYPGGRGFPTFEIQYNTSENHKAIAELIERQWRKALSIDVRLRNQEWASHLASVRRLDYDVARAGWIGDYADPNTFLDMFVTDAALNQTGWKNEEYDKLIRRAAREPDPKQRLDLLHDAEAILMQDLPVIPIYFRVSSNMVRPYVKGFYSNIQDVHPLGAIWIDEAEKRADQRREATP